MFIKVLIPSMFHRRLLLLMTLLGVGFVPLAARMGSLTLARGEELEKDARSRLIRSRQTPTVRGAIVDRKGRVLAQDRPSYDLAVEYPVIDGSWAGVEARKAAARSVGSEWGGLSREAREEAASRFEPVFRVHLESAWDRLAGAARVTRKELDDGRDRVVRRVQSQQSAVVAYRERTAKAELEESGEPISDKQRETRLRRARAPIAEQGQAHVVLSGIDDRAAFECFALAAEQVELALPSSGDSRTLSRDLPVGLVDAVPGLEVVDSGAREYPAERARVVIDRSTFPGPVASGEPATIEVDGLACHLLGTLRETVYQSAPADPSRGQRATTGDAERRAAFLLSHPAIRERAVLGLGIDRGSYRDGDRIGATGLEHAQENTLRGLRGVQTSRLDTGERVVVVPVKGGDAHLTLDIALQARVQAVMDPRLGLATVQPWHKQQSPTQKIGDPLHGAAVVLDIDTGDVLALVSTPTFTREELRTDRARLAGDVLSAPLVNRATGKYYTPGSIVKPLMLVEAVKQGKCDLSGTISCSGHLFPNQPLQFRCWIYKQFATTHDARLGHEPDAAEALTVSCNIFFFTLGRRLGPGGVITAYENFGVGRTFGLGVGGEAAGAIGFSRMKADRGMGTPDAIQTGIGQGPVTWTPLHAANAYATLARGGVWVAPRVVANAPRPEPHDLSLDPRAVTAAMHGLDGSVNLDIGTGNHIATEQGRLPIFNAPGVRVWGKTGTADAPAIVGDPDGPEGPAPREVLEDGDHSWFVILVGRDRPRFVISVVVDFGGSGGKVSGPIANQIIHSLIAEGYL